MLNDNSIKRDIIKNYKLLKTNNILRFNNTYLRDRTNELSASKLILDLNLVMNLIHKVIFCTYIRLKMFVQAIQSCVK